MMAKIHGKEVKFCTTCRFPDGEPIMHVMAPGNCKRVQEELADQSIAEQLRKAYFSQNGVCIASSWKSLGANAKADWVRVARLARELFA